MITLKISGYQMERQKCQRNYELVKGVCNFRKNKQAPDVQSDQNIIRLLFVARICISSAI
jgi:hypothetical protein